MIVLYLLFLFTNCDQIIKLKACSYWSVSWIVARAQVQRKGQFTCLDVLALIRKPLSVQNICLTQKLGHFLCGVFLLQKYSGPINNIVHVKLWLQ